MVPPLNQQQLREGIQAVRQGDRRRGEALLLQVVAADECDEPAWLWLSQAVTAPVDQLAALEHALRLNPDNDAARAKVRALRDRRFGFARSGIGLLNAAELCRGSGAPARRS